jgi:hypothetical protein
MILMRNTSRGVLELAALTTVYKRSLLSGFLAVCQVLVIPLSGKHEINDTLVRLALILRASHSTE